MSERQTDRARRRPGRPIDPEADTVVRPVGEPVADTIVARPGPGPARPKPAGGALPARRSHRLRVALVPPLAAYAVTAVLQLVVLALMLPAGQGGVRDKLLAWDAHWYVEVAVHGYPSGLQYDDQGQLRGSTLAHFPLYPAVIRLVHLATGLDYDTSALVASRLAGAAAAIAVYHLFARLHDRRAALVMVVLVCTQPMSVSLSMAYTEGLFLALAAAALVAAHRDAWLLAGVCALFAGLTRSTGLAVTAALVFAAVWRLREGRGVTWRVVAGCVLGCVGVPAYLLWVAARTGRLDGWMAIQEAGWGTRWDWGASTWRFIGETLAKGDGWVALSTALLLIAVAVCCLIAAMERVWPPLIVYGLIIFALTVGQTNYYHSKLRLLVPALLALAPLAVALTRARPRTAAVVLGAFALFGTWYGAYMLTAWHYAV